jgi:hypothetical protein
MLIGICSYGCPVAKLKMGRHHLIGSCSDPPTPFEWIETQQSTLLFLSKTSTRLPILPRSSSPALTSPSHHLPPSSTP